jgi:hypothetical protein
LVVALLTDDNNQTGCLLLIAKCSCARDGEVMYRSFSRGKIKFWSARLTQSSVPQFMLSAATTTM